MDDAPDFTQQGGGRAGYFDQAFVGACQKAGQHREAACSCRSADAIGASPPFVNAHRRGSLQTGGITIAQAKAESAVQFKRPTAIGAEAIADDAG